MSENSTTTQKAARKGLPLVILATAALMFAKLTAFHAITWFWVFSPILIYLLAVAIYCAIPVAFFLIAAICVGVAWAFVTAVSGVKGLAAWRRKKAVEAVLNRASKLA